VLTCAYCRVIGPPLYAAVRCTRAQELVKVRFDSLLPALRVAAPNDYAAFIRFFDLQHPVGSRRRRKNVGRVYDAIVGALRAHQFDGSHDQKWGLLMNPQRQTWTPWKDALWRFLKDSLLWGDPERRVSTASVNPVPVRDRRNDGRLWVVVEEREPINLLNRR
jgi:hypothetical protein